MSYQVLLTHSAEQDLADICDHITEHDSPQNADHVIEKILAAAAALTTFPERGAYPKELITLGIREYRQTHWQSYRLIYRIIGKQVFIYLIADGRRDLQTLLARRMLGD